jgi:hypothetical protein
MAYAERAALRAELRAHLEALVEAYVELGSSRDEAIGSALAQFGDPDLLAGEWRRQGRRAPCRAQRPLLKSTLIGLLCFGEAHALSLALMMQVRDGVFLWGGIFPAMALLFPALAGLATGVLARFRPTLGALYAMLAMLPGMVIAMPHLFPPSDAPGILIFGEQLPVFWLPIGIGAAALGARLRGTREEAIEGRPVLS